MGGLSFSASYTLSRSIDDASDPGATSYEANLPQEVRNMAAGRAVSSFDHRHRFVGNVTWALPTRFWGGGFQVRLELRWEVFNFGRIFSASPARQMQLGLKLIF